MARVHTSRFVARPMSAPYARTIYATDPASAQAAVKVLAKRDGYRVVDVTEVVLEDAPPKSYPPRYTVTLAVDPLPTLRGDCE